MSRTILYIMNNAGTMIPFRKTYSKARYRKYMSRWHNADVFHKNRRDERLTGKK